MFSFLFRLLVLISHILLLSMFCWVIDKIKYLPIVMGIKRKERTPETAYNVGGESSSTSNTLNSTSGGKYDVFLSFAGKDTRLKFTDHLYDALRRSGIKAFRDNEGIERGEVISDQLIQAIKDSSCAVVVLSESYANSTWCLNELQKILECKRKLEQRVFPIFYDIDPSDVKHQRKNFGEALAKHEKRFGLNKVQNWRNALSEISHLSGWDTRGRPEAELIKDIVAKVSTHLHSKLPSFDDSLVGIESKVLDMVKILDIGWDGKRSIGIWGMGGVGKTTLARVVYKKISYSFEVCCFILNFRDTLQKEGLVSLQKKLLSDLKIKGMKISNSYEGKEMIRKHLANKKVLLVVDDLDDTSQLEYLAESLDWFGYGSRIIITTRDRHLLTASGVHRVYAMKTMKLDESLQLFSKKAFKEDYPEKDYLELSEFVVKYAGGLPLALEVLGSYFCGRSKAEWKDALNRLKKVTPSKRIFEVLKISYDGLDENEKTIFLDIVCFFKHWKKKKVTQILKSCDLCPTIGIKVLIEKALLVETEYGRLDMHDLIEELGRDIVHQESPNDICKRSRLWEFKDIKELLENNKGPMAIQAIVRQDNFENRGRIKVHPEAFSKMCSIRLLKSNLHTEFGDRFKFPDTLKVVLWPSFPLRALPLETPLNELVHVEMRRSRMMQIFTDIQPMKLKFMDLSYSECIFETPDFSGVPYLECLRLCRCTSLQKVHPSLGELKELVEVDLHGCRNLETLPRKLKTNSLVKLSLESCGRVKVLPEFGKGMGKLSYLGASGIAMTRLPESFGSLTGLTYLNLVGCHLNDESIPDDFGSFSSLIVLDLSHNDFVNLPIACFSSLFRLLYLSLSSCKKLKSLPRLPPQLIRLNASYCDSMEPLSSDRQLWNLVASLDNQYRGHTKYVISDEKWDDSLWMFKHTELNHLPLRDFFANVPGCKIPSWFPNKSSVPNESNKSSFRNCEHVIEVKVPPHLRDSEWTIIVVCLHILHDFSGLITWSSKAPEDDDYIWKEWAHRSTIWRGQNRHLCIMVLELNEKTCWRHLKAGESSLHIKLYAQNSPFFHLIASRLGPIPVSDLECGWRVIGKEEIQKWCNDNDFNQLTQSQLASPHDEINLPSRVFSKLIANAYDKQGIVRNPWKR